MDEFSHVSKRKSGFLLLDLGGRIQIQYKKCQTYIGLGLECTMNLYTEEENVEKVPICSIFGQPRNLKDCVY